MEIQTIRKGFETKFETIERDSKISNPTSNHLKGIRTIPMQILTIRKGFEVFESKFWEFEKDS